MALLLAITACSAGGRPLEQADAGGHSNSDMAVMQNDLGSPDAVCEADCIFTRTSISEIPSCTLPSDAAPLETSVGASQVSLWFRERGSNLFDEVSVELWSLGDQAILTGRRILRNCGLGEVRLAGRGECSDVAVLGAFGFLLEDGERLCPELGQDASSVLEVRVPPSSSAEWLLFDRAIPTDAEWTVCGVAEVKDLNVDRVVGLEVRWRRATPSCPTGSIWADPVDSGTRSATVSFQNRDALRDAFIRVLGVH